MLTSFTLILIFCSVCYSSYSKLLIVSYDGFRFDYLSRNITPVLNSLAENGSSARFMMNTFPTQTFPNHFSIATGLYSEVHGVLASDLFIDSTKRELKYGYELWHYNDEVVPIWTLNEQAGQGRHSGLMMWPGSEFPYNGTTSTHITKFNTSIPWTERVDTVIQWFTDPTHPANLVLLYFEEPDNHSHAFGPDSPQVNAQIRRTDNITLYILSQFANANLTDVDMIFLSDHGMESTNETNIINLSEMVGDMTKMYGTSPVLQIYPEPDKSETVYRILKNASIHQRNFEVYRKSEIPQRLHYRNCDRAPPILAVAHPHYAFDDLYSSIETMKQNFPGITDNQTFGIHGYDPALTNMHAFIIAKGPSFKTNFTSEPFNNVDLYLLFAELLDLELPAIKPNGTIDIVQGLLVPQFPLHITSSFILASVVIIVLSFSGACVLVLFIYSKNKPTSKIQYLSRIVDLQTESQSLLICTEDES